MTDVWTAFVAARLAEDEAAAQAAPWELDDGQWPFRVTLDPFRVTDEAAARAYVSQFRPIRALRQVAALRVILAEHAPISTPPICNICSEDAPCKTLRALAAIWADHADQPGHQDHSVV